MSAASHEKGPTPSRGSAQPRHARAGRSVWMAETGAVEGGAQWPECQNCRFYVATGGNMGDCRFNPPLEGLSNWPKSCNWDWCGEFHARVR